MTDLERAKEFATRYALASSIELREVLTIEFAKIRAEGRDAGIEEAAKRVSAEVFVVLGRHHPEGRATAHRDAQVVGELVEKIRELAKQEKS